MSDETRGRLAGKSQGAASASEPPEVADALTAPPPRARDDAEKAIAAVLRDHRDRSGCFEDKCTCGHTICPDDGGMSHDWHYAEHVASVLADLMADTPEGDR